MDSQIAFDARILGRTAEPGRDAPASWIVASDDLRTRACHRGMFMSGGYSLAVLGRRFRTHPPSAIHAHFGVVATQHRQLAWRLRCPLVASFYGYDASMDRYIAARAWRARYRRLFRDVAAVLVEGPVMAERVAALGCPDAKLRIVRLPADAAGLSRVIRQVPDTFLVVLAGRFVAKKGFDTGVRAFARALRGRDARLLMVGGGEARGGLPAPGPGRGDHGAGDLARLAPLRAVHVADRERFRRALSEQVRPLTATPREGRR